jgi:hypothetical protein
VPGGPVRGFVVEVVHGEDGGTGQGDKGVGTEEGVAGGASYLVAVRR